MAEFSPSTEAARSADKYELLAEHEALIVELQSALKDHPESNAVKMPFHPAFRPETGQEPTPDQQAAIRWRTHLGAVMERLRDHVWREQHPCADPPFLGPKFKAEQREGLLERFPLAGYDDGLSYQEYRNWTSTRVVAALEHHKQQLQRDLDKLRDAVAAHAQPISGAVVSGSERPKGTTPSVGERERPQAATHHADRPPDSRAVVQRGSPIPLDLPQELQDIKRKLGTSWNKLAELAQLDPATLRKIRSGVGRIDDSTSEKVERLRQLAQAKPKPTVPQ